MADGTIHARKRPGKKGPTKYAIDRGWFISAYHEQKLPIGEIAKHIGCSRDHVQYMASHYGLPRRDGRAGRISHGQRVQIDLSRAAWLYEVERMNCNEIGAQFSVSGDVVRRRLRDAGIRIRHHNETKRGAKARNRSDVNERRVVSAYQKDGETIDSVASAFGVNRKVIRRILGEHGVPLKPLSIVRPIAGALNPNWRPELSDEERSARRDTFRQAEWREAVYQRDAFTCRRCGDGNGGNLNAHHIVAHCEDEALRWDVDNGITLCGECHRGFHRRYGLKGFGRAHLDEWLIGSRCIERSRLMRAA